jgi:hypothetical protein
MSDARTSSNQKFKSTPEAHAIQRGKMWVSQIDEPPCGFQSAAGRGNVLVFAGCDLLTLNVSEARALRDWLTGVLPVETSPRRISYDELHRYMYRMFEFGKTNNAVSAQCECQALRIAMGWTGKGASIPPKEPTCDCSDPVASECNGGTADRDCTCDCHTNARA